MNEREIEFLREKLLQVAHHVFVDIRNLASRGADAIDQIRDLADTAELIPEQLQHWEDIRYELIHNGLTEYARKYPWPARRLLDTLDMDRSSFELAHAAPTADLWNTEPSAH